ncbi:unnamed protein product, partial [marine sediment metagenome]
MIMKVLVTGGDGFVAPHLADRLSQDGHDIFLTTRNVSNKDSKFVYMDLLDQKSINNIFSEKNFDIVFHLAAMTHIPTCIQNPLLAFRANALGTAYICDAIQKFSKDTLLMNCSTGSVYGKHSGIITEDCPISPVEPYGVSKTSAELYVTDIAKIGLIKAFSTRTFSHTGPGRGERFSISSDAIQIARIIKKKQSNIIDVGNLKSQRVVADVRDIVDVYCLLVEKFIDGDIES